MSAEKPWHERLRQLWEETFSLPAPDQPAPTETIRTTAAGSAHAGTASSQIRRRRLSGGVGEHGDGGDYELLDLLGRGGMGAVFAARQVGVERSVAVKLMREDRGTDPRARERFAAEARVTGALEHPNIVPVFELGAGERDQLFYTMRHVEGRDWADLLPAQDLEQRLAVWLRVADAIGFAHSRGVIHCDLKPANVVLGDYGEVLVVDWGLALVFDEQGVRPASADGSIGGTPAYMPPEIARGEAARIGPAVDIYLLGALLCEVLTGQAPHSDTAAISALRAAAENRIVALPAHGLSEIALRAMAADPAARYPDVSALRDAVHAWRRHRRGEELARRAEATLQAAVADGSDERFADALFTWEEAVALWPEAPERVAGPLRVRRAWASAAAARGDHGQVLEIAADHGPGDPDLARLAGAATRARARAQRRARWRRGLAMAALLLVTAIAAISAVGMGVVREQRRTALAEEAAARSDAALARAATERALAASAAADRANYRSAMRAAWVHWMAGRGREARAALAQCPPAERGWEWTVLDGQVADGQIAVPLLAPRPFDVRFLARDRHLAIAHRDGRVAIRSAQDLELLATIALPRAARQLCPLPDGRVLATAGSRLFVLAAQGGPVLERSISGWAEARSLIATAAGGDAVLVGNRAGEVALVDLATGWVRRLPAVEGRVLSLLVTDGWAFVATDVALYQRPLASGAPPLASAGAWTSVPIDDEVAIKAMAPYRGGIVFWAEHTQRAGHLASRGWPLAGVSEVGTPVTDVRFSADGAWALGHEPGAAVHVLAPVARGGAPIACWYPVRGSEAQDLAGHGRSVVIANDGWLRLDTAPRASGLATIGISGAMSRVAVGHEPEPSLYLADSAGLLMSMALADWARDVHRGRPPMPTLPMAHTEGSARELLSDPDGGGYWAVGSEGVHRYRPGGELEEVPGLAGEWNAAARAPLGDGRLALATRHGEIVIADGERVLARQVIAEGEVIHDLVWDPTGTALYASVSDVGLIRLDVVGEHLERRWQRPLARRGGAVARGPQGEVVVGNGTSVLVCRADDGAVLAEIPSGGIQVTAIASIDGGRRVVIGTDEGWMSLVDTGEWQTLASWRGALGAITDFAWYAPEDLLIAVAYRSDVILLGPEVRTDRRR